ncbi:MAG: ABC transporter permease [Actinocatenispora sp.]
MSRVIRSELLKVRTTNLWWLMLIGVVVFTALSLGVNMLSGYVQLNPDSANGQNVPKADIVHIATNLYTSGQYFGTLLAMVFGILIFTNEFFHQTATATFLATPKRTHAIGGKLFVAVVVGIVIALITSALSMPSGALFLSSQDAALHLGDASVLKSIGLNWLAFAVWAVFGLGLGALLRSQILAVIVGLVAMLVGQTVLQLVLGLLAQHYHQAWIMDISYWLPSGASGVMTSPDGAGGFAWWQGTLILLGYGVVAAVVGTIITQRRDVS